jgi:hypothetical protein
MRKKLKSISGSDSCAGSVIQTALWFRSNGRSTEVIGDQIKNHPMRKAIRRYGDIKTRVVLLYYFAKKQLRIGLGGLE